MQAANTYAQALFDLALEEQLDTLFLEQLQVLRRSFRAEPALIPLLCAHGISKQERCQVLDNSFRDRVHIYVLNFLKLLTEKGNMGQFFDCCKAFERLYREKHRILPVKVVTAVPIQEKQAERLTQKLSRITGKTVQLYCKVDPAALGGVRLDYDGKRVDGTVQNRLARLGDLLKK